MIKNGLGIAALCLVSACVTQPGEMRLPGPQQHALPHGQTFPARDYWWRALNDTQLNQYVETALYSAPSLRSAQARFAQLGADLGVLDASGKLQVGLGAEGVGVLLSKRPPSEFAESDRSLLVAHAAAQAKWSFDFWGKNRAQIQAALGRRNALYYETRQTEILLANTVAVQYFSWQGLEAQKAVLNRRIDNAKQIEKLLQSRVGAQLAAPSAVYPAQQAQRQFELQKLQLDKEIARILHGLDVLSGRPPVPLNIRKPAAMAPVPDVKTDGLKADLLGRRPDIAAQRALLAMRSHNIRAAKADFYPNVELRLLAGLSHIDAFDLVRSNSGMLGIVPAVNLPIFTSGALRSNLAKRRGEYEEQIAIYDQTVLDAMRAAADALSDYRNLMAQYEAALGLQAAAEKSAASMLRRANAGLEHKTLYYQKQDEVLQQQALVSAKHAEVLAAWSNLHAQLGGGFQE
ncbi:MAG: efflux transporter outer membrane subunit [Neisseria sp.]|uniref:efflux transporter outer membrane subunit n=1 Tax=Neisseria sp. TaxID=192066 RepID=UPI0026DC42FA|nr:efflux transporter outer membrane subunit [Neisseria sp.]MDO4249125.1 efflux transporter outer membrane subunit [Neisseria sp.]